MEVGPDCNASGRQSAQAFSQPSPALIPFPSVDIGDSDRFVEKELRPELLEAPCAPAGIALSLRYEPGYDHSYYMISARSSCPITWLGMRRDCEGDRR